MKILVARNLVRASNWNQSTTPNNAFLKHDNAHSFNLTLCFISCKGIDWGTIIITTFKYRVSCTVNCTSQEREETTRPVENVALTTKGVQGKKKKKKKNTTYEWEDGGKIGKMTIIINDANSYTQWDVENKYILVFETWCYRKMQKISCTDNISNEVCESARAKREVWGGEKDTGS